MTAPLHPQVRLVDAGDRTRTLYLVEAYDGDVWEQIDPMPLTIAGYRGPYVEPDRAKARPRRRAATPTVFSGRCKTCGARWTSTASRDADRRFCSRQHGRTDCDGESGSHQS